MQLATMVLWLALWNAGQTIVGSVLISHVGFFSPDLDGPWTWLGLAAFELEAWKQRPLKFVWIVRQQKKKKNKEKGVCFFYIRQYTTPQCIVLYTMRHHVTPYYTTLLHITLRHITVYYTTLHYSAVCHFTGFFFFNEQE